MARQKRSYIQLCLHTKPNKQREPHSFFFSTSLLLLLHSLCECLTSAKIPHFQQTVFIFCMFSFFILLVFLSFWLFVSFWSLFCFLISRFFLHLCFVLIRWLVEQHWWQESISSITVAPESSATNEQPRQTSAKPRDHSVDRLMWFVS